MSHMASRKVGLHILSQAVCPDAVCLENLFEGNKRREEVSCADRGARMIPLTQRRGDSFVGRQDLPLSLWGCPGKLISAQKEIMLKEM